MGKMLVQHDRATRRESHNFVPGNGNLTATLRDEQSILVLSTMKNVYVHNSPAAISPHV